ncbi:MAG: hypothetical protein HY556_12280 [Euryarchaeota archaeon]|nr:hypothetical protein [Euryarchaeota archaeon]
MKRKDEAKMYRVGLADVASVSGAAVGGLVVSGGLSYLMGRTDHYYLWGDPLRDSALTLVGLAGLAYYSLRSWKHARTMVSAPRERS